MADGKGISVGGMRWGNGDDIFDGASVCGCDPGQVLDVDSLLVPSSALAW